MLQFMRLQIVGHDLVTVGHDLVTEQQVILSCHFLSHCLLFNPNNHLNELDIVILLLIY